MQKFYIKYREREKIFQIQAESEQDAIIIAKQLITSKYLLSPESDLTLVLWVDDIATIHVVWDCGSNLVITYYEDLCKKIY